MQTTALIENLDGNFVGPEHYYLEEAMRNAKLSDDNFSDYLDMKGSDSYPFIMMNYVIIKGEVSGK